MITIKEATSQAELKAFVRFPFSLYKESPYWVPPIIKDELETFNKDKNPVFKSAKAQFFLAYKDNTIVGRVAAIINTIEIEQQQLKKMRFGWFDFIDDTRVSEALIDKVAEIGSDNQLQFMEGPVGFTNLDKVGILIEGFDHIGTMITWYNPPYYASHLERLGFVKEKEYLENKFEFKNANPKTFGRIQLLIKKRYQLRELNFTKTKDVLPYADKMFDLFNESYRT